MLSVPSTVDTNAARVYPRPKWIVDRGGDYMLVELQTRRRALELAYRRYVVADNAWNLSTLKAMSWFPGTRQAHVAIIGNPGSNVRRLYKQRERAMLQLETARLKLEVAKSRLMKRRHHTTMETLLIGCSQT